MKKTRNKKIVSIDLDGTLFESYNVISDYAIDVIQKIVKLGHYLIINTGRGPYEVHKLIEQNKIGIKKPNVFYGVTNGAQLWNNMDLLYDVRIHECATEVVKFLIDNDFIFVVSSGSDYFSNKNSWMVDIWKKWGNKVKITSKFPSKISQIVVVKLRDNDSFCSGSYNTLINTYNDRIKFFWQTDLSYKDTHVTCLSLGPLDADKALPLKFLAKEKSIARENIIAFGDSFNDEEMLIYAGESFAMKNGAKEIQAISKYTTAFPNYEQGVAKTLIETFKDEL